MHVDEDHLKLDELNTAKANANSIKLPGNLFYTLGCAGVTF